MSDKVTELYKALDIAIGGFEARMIEASIKAIEREKRAVEAKMLQRETVLTRQIMTLTKQIEESRKPMPAPSISVPQPPTRTTPTILPPRPAAPVFPPLPKPLTVGSLTEYVQRQGFRVANNRPLGGGLWVFHDEKAFGDMAEHLENAGVTCEYYPNGRSRRTGPQYNLDTLKRLSP